MSRADLKFLLKVIAFVLLVIAGGVVAGFKILSGPDPVSLDCKAFATKASTGAVYPVAEATLERQTSDSAKWCELAGVGPDGARDVVKVTVERFEDDASSKMDGCDQAAGCLMMVDGAGTPGSNGATATIVLADGDLRVEVEARLSATTLQRVEGLAAGAGQTTEAFVLGDLARFADAAAELAGH